MDYRAAGAAAYLGLINPFWMLPLLGVLGVRARELVGYSILQLMVHAPMLFFRMWLLAPTLPYHPPVLP
jgi:short-chain fatty acids transporter